MVPLTDRATQLLALTSAFFALGWICVLLRVYVRVKLVKAFGIDDWLIVVSLALYTVFSVFLFVGIQHGIGNHDRDLSPENNVTALKFQILCQIVYCLTTMLVKLSVGFLLLRIIPNGNRRYRWVLYGSMVFVAIWSIITAGIILFQCSPVPEAWNRTGNGKCLAPISITNTGYAFSAMDILFDWLFALIPVPILYDVKMTIQMKLSILLILGMGVFASVATIVRLKYLIAFTEPADILYVFVPTLTWTVTEIGLGISAASIATFRPLFKHFHIKGFSNSSSNGPSTNRANYVQSYDLGYIAKGGDGGMKSNVSHQTHTRALSEGNTSQESILEHRGPGIQKRMDVDVSYEHGVGSGNGKVRELV